MPDHTIGSVAARSGTDSVLTRLRRSSALRRAVVSVRARGLTSDDAVLASYPKCGSTWLRFMLAQLAQREADFDLIRSVIPPVGAHRGAAPLTAGTTGRLVRSHEAADRFRSFPPRRVILLVRDGRDVAVSYYFYLRRSQDHRGPFGDFLDRFLDGHVGVYGSWQHHTRSWLDMQDRRDVLLLRYEELVDQGPEALRRPAALLGLDVDDTMLDQAWQANLPDRMRELERRSERFADGAQSGVSLVRKATAGGWREHFTAAQHQRYLDRVGEVHHLLGYATTW